MELTGKCDWRGRRIAELEETLKRTQHLQDQAAAQARKLQEDLTLALRLQSLAQSDLRELQQRHAEVLATRDRQADLLRQLTPRLQEAARYLGALRSLPESEATPTPASLPKDTPDRRDKGSGKAKAGKTKGAKRDKATRSSRPQV